jgi:pseudouridine synthase
VLDLLPTRLRTGAGLHPIGRLDGDSRGALLLSNDGDLTLRLTHPSFGHRKTYRVWVRGWPTPDTLRLWRAGVPLDGRPCQPVRVRRLDRSAAAPLAGGAPATLLELEMGEGRNRQIRRTGDRLGHPVLDLQRCAIGAVQIGNLAEGEWRIVDRAELDPQEWGRPESRR